MYIPRSTFTFTLGAIASLLAVPSARAQSNVTVTLSSEKQLIRGFGGISIPEWQGSDLSAAQQATAFGNGPNQIGMSVLRIWVSDDKNGWSKAVPTAKAAIARGAIVFATPWYPPSTMRTTTNSSTAKYTMNTSSFSAYVTHLNDFVAYMKTNGVDLHAISITNEPDYASDWTYWSVDQVYQFTLNYADKINTRVISAESFQYRKDLYDKILNDPKALANIDILGTHTYGTQVSAFSYPLFDQKAAPAGKERWMTEHYTESSNDADLWPMALDVGTDIHNTMVEGQFSAYVWWFIRRKYSPMKEDGNISKRGFCFAQYSKFVRPGAKRVDATKSPTSGVSVSAYKKADSVVVVVVNKNTSASSLKISIPGITSTGYSKYTTSSSKSLKDDGTGALANGAFTASVDAQSVTTFLLTGNKISTGIPVPDVAPTAGEYHIYSTSGMWMGSVTVTDPAALESEVRKLAPRAGLYLAKPRHGVSAVRVNVAL